MKTRELLDALISSYRCKGDIFLAEELRLSTGFGGKRSEQRIDLWTMKMTPSQKHWRVAYELKVSRADWLKEKKDPLKRRGARLLSNQFYFVTPPGLIKPEEIPIDCGLLEFVERKKKYDSNFKVVVDAPKFDTEPPPWGFVASMMRRGVKTDRERRTAELGVQGRIAKTLELLHSYVETVTRRTQSEISETGILNEQLISSEISRLIANLKD